MVPPLEIHVDGKGSSFRTAERGYLRLRISSTSTDQSQASSEVQSATSRLTSIFRAMATKTEGGRPHPDAAVTAFTVTPLSTVSCHPRDSHYRQLTDRPKDHTVSASAEIIFRDMAKLADVSSELARMPHVSMSGTEWRLTEATRAEVEREARRKAMANAVQKAQDYAAVVGREVVAVEIKDQPQASTGWYGATQPQHLMQQMQQTQQHQAAQQAAQLAPAQQTSEGLTLEPKTITVSASVNAKFVSKDGVGNAGRKRSREAEDLDM
jgi:uncharacterized protein YggE